MNYVIIIAVLIFLPIYSAISDGDSKDKEEFSKHMVNISERLKYFLTKTLNATLNVSKALNDELNLLADDFQGIKAIFLAQYNIEDNVLATQFRELEEGLEKATTYLHIMSENKGSAAGKELEQRKFTKLIHHIADSVDKVSYKLYRKLLESMNALQAIVLNFAQSLVNTGKAITKGLSKILRDKQH